MGPKLGYLINYISVHSSLRGYHKIYTDFLNAKYNSLEINSFMTRETVNLALEEVFVEIKLVPDFVTGGDPMANPPHFIEYGSHNIWSLLNEEYSRNLAVIGSPGCGKTTLLRYIAVVLANRTRKTPEYIPTKLPILLFINDYAQIIANNPNVKLLEVLQHSLKGITQQIPSGWFEKQLKAGYCLVMFDGLDEVANASIRQKVVKWLEMQMTAYHRNRFIVTSRPDSYRSNPIMGLTQLDIQSFNIFQIREFIEKWYIATGVMGHQEEVQHVYLEGQPYPEDILHQIFNTPGLAELAANPLLLTMMANIQGWNTPLPRRRVELYTEMLDVSLSKRKKKSGVKAILTSAQKQSVLEYLAYEMMRQEKLAIMLPDLLSIVTPQLRLIAAEIEGIDFVNLICDSSGILIKRDIETYAFSHKTLQEFLAANHITEQKLLAEILERINHDWWYETIRFYCSQNDATSVVDACIDQTPIPLARLTLAIDCAARTPKLDDAIEKRLRIIMEENLESNDVEQSTIVARATLALRLHRIAHLDDNLYADRTLISHAEFQLFLNERPGYMPIHWHIPYFPKGQAKKPVVGVSADAAEAFCDWLTQRSTGIWQYRLPHQGEVEPGFYWEGSQSQYTLAKMQPTQRPMSEWMALVSDAEALELRLDKDLLNELIVVNSFDPSLERIFFSPLMLASIQLKEFSSQSPNIHMYEHILNGMHVDLNHARLLSLTYNLASDLNNALDHASSRISPLFHASAIARALAADLSSDTVTNFTNGLATDLDRILASACTFAQGVYDKELLQWVNLFHRVSRLLVILTTCLKSNGSTLQLEIKTQILSHLAPLRHIVLQSIYNHYANQPDTPNTLIRDEWTKWRMNLDEMLQTYAMHVTLAMRVQGEWDAFEGIRIVRERMEDN